MADQKIMTLVMKLLERAEHPETNAHEAAACRERAEALMAQHMIDRMDLKPEEKSTVVTDLWDLRVGDAGTEFYYHVSELMAMVVRHCGIRVHPKTEYVRDESGRVTDYNTRRFKLVGFPEDMAYAEQIWFRVFRDFVANVNPQWDVSKPLSDNVYAFIKAGFSWIDTYRIARKIQYQEWPEKMPNGGPRLRTAYKEALAERGEGFTKTRTRDAYRATFVQSYGSTIRRRLDDMREKAKETVSDSDKFALAVRSTKEQVDEEFYRLFPEFDPEIRRKMHEAAEFQAACEFAELPTEVQERVIRAEAERQRKDDEAWARAAKRTRRNYGAIREKATYDHSAWERGRDVGNKVNLTVDTEMDNKKRGEIQ